MSIQAIRNGLFATLTACGPYAAAEISACSFDVLEATAACAITYFPNGISEIEPDRQGTYNSRNYYRTWRIGGTLWLRDTGDPQALLGRIWQGYDDLFNTLSKDDSLNGSACAARLASISTERDRFWEAGGHLWKPVEWTVIAEEF